MFLQLLYQQHAFWIKNLHITIDIPWMEITWLDKHRATG